jgi:hypothetical protein
VSSSSIPQLFHNSSATSPVSESLAVGWTYGLYMRNSHSQMLLRRCQCRKGGVTPRTTAGRAHYQSSDSKEESNDYIKKDSRFLLEKKSWTSMFQYDPMTLKAASDYRAERARKDFQSDSLLGRSVLSTLLWELGFILSLPVRVPVFLWGKLRRSVNRTIVFPLGREQKASRGFLGEEH